MNLRGDADVHVIAKKKKQSKHFNHFIDIRHQSMEGQYSSNPVAKEHWIAISADNSN